MAKKEEREFTLNPEVQKLLDEYGESDRVFNTAWSVFEDGNKEKFELLEDLAEERNAKLQLAITALRDNAKEVDYEQVASIKVGHLTVSKKRSYYFPPEAFHQRLTDLGVGMLEGAFSEGVLVQKLEVAYPKAKDWLQRNSLWDQFKDLECFNDLTPSVAAPGLIPPFGLPYKAKK